MALRTPSTIAVKIGSAIVAPGGRLDEARIAALADQVAWLRSAGHRVLVVSSGAVACGLSALGLKEMPSRIADRQAAAAAGQPMLMSAWGLALSRHGLRCAQVLLTGDDVEHRERFVNARRTIERLLEAGVVPVINENDSVAFDEIRLGDNDRLSALAAGVADADLLVILSSAPGVCAGGSGGPVIPVLDDPAAAQRHVSADRTATGVGGMSTKLEAAAMAQRMGVETVIAAGVAPGVLRAIALGEAVGTRIPAGGAAASARKLWILHARRIRGRLTVDAGARRAIREGGASLLPKGVTAVASADPQGFGVGAAVEVVHDGTVVARGLVSYRSDEIARIAGRRSDEIASILGQATCDEVIHRDNLIVAEASP